MAAGGQRLPLGARGPYWAVKHNSPGLLDTLRAAASQSCGRRFIKKKKAYKDVNIDWVGA